MIHLSSKVKAFLLPDYFDSTLTNDIDYFISICKKYELQPFSGDIYAFIKDDQTVIGLLSYDGQGFNWCIKRMSKGHFYWPSIKIVTRIHIRDLQIILWGGNPNKENLSPDFKPLH